MKRLDFDVFDRAFGFRDEQVANFANVEAVRDVSLAPQPRRYA
jgi:hypothetical protein